MRHRFLLLALCLPLTAAAQSVEQPPWSLDRLMQQRAQVQTARATFVETRKLSGHTQRSNGVLTYNAPDRLERETLAPSPERIVVQNERITMEFEISPGQTSSREFDLTRVPAMRPFFVAMRSLLAGDVETLQRTFEVTVDGNDAAWKIKLVPREQADKQTREILFSGRGKDLYVVELRHNNGDSSQTQLTPVSSELKTPEKAANARGS